MLTHRIGCLPVMRGETLVGIITRSDLLVAFMTIHEHYAKIEKKSNGLSSKSARLSESADNPPLS
jgi:predicted transcriptional regulator